MNKKQLIRGLEFTYKGGEGSGHRGHGGGAGGKGNPGGSIAGGGGGGKGPKASSSSKPVEVVHGTNNPKRTNALLKERGLENLEGIKVDVRSYTKDVSDALGGLENMPPEIVKTLGEAGITLTFGEGNFLDFEEQSWMRSFDKENVAKGEVSWAEGAGAFHPTTKTVYVGTMSGRRLDGKEVSRRTAAHEFGHAVDYNARKGKVLSSTPEFKAVYKKVKSRLTPYELEGEGLGQQETFATRFGQYFGSSSSNAALKGSFPELHSYMKDQFGEGP